METIQQAEDLMLFGQNNGKETSDSEEHQNCNQSNEDLDSEDCQESNDFICEKFTNFEDTSMDNMTSVAKACMNPDHKTLDNIPDGEKSECQFIVKNPNIERFKNNQRARNPKDDRGPYGKPGNNTHTFELKNGGLEFCTDIKYLAKEKRCAMTSDNRVPPDSRNLFVVRRVYANLRDYPMFQKRLLYFLQTPGDHIECPWYPEKKFSSLKTKVFVEYPNKDPQGISTKSCHGKNRVSEHPYRAGNANVVNGMEGMLGQMKKNKNWTIHTNLKKH